MKVNLALNLVRVIFKMSNGEIVIHNNQVVVPDVGELVSLRVRGIAVPVSEYVKSRLWAYESGVAAVQLVMEKERSNNEKPAR